MNKIIGFILLVAGLVLIGFSLWQSYAIFFGKTSAPLVFKTSVPLQQTANRNATTIEQQIQAQISDAVQKQLGQIISPDSITKILNLLSWSIFAGILILGGAAISGIGAKLLR